MTQEKLAEFAICVLLGAVIAGVWLLLGSKYFFGLIVIVMLFMVGVMTGKES